jgi:hypothetical protein
MPPTNASPVVSSRPDQVWVDADPRNADAAARALAQQRLAMLQALRVAANGGGAGPGASRGGSPPPPRPRTENQAASANGGEAGDAAAAAVANPFLSLLPPALRPAAVVAGQFGLVDDEQYAQRNEVRYRGAFLEGVSAVGSCAFRTLALSLRLFVFLFSTAFCFSAPHPCMSAAKSFFSSPSFFFTLAPLAEVPYCNPPPPFFS